jgi:GNAT superfamily N-acetyltransferase
MTKAIARFILTRHAGLNGTLMSITTKYHDLLRDRYSEVSDRSFDQGRLDKLVALDEDGRYDNYEERWQVTLLAIHPTFQGHGIGSMLLERGCQIADSEGIPSLVNSSPVGERLYSKLGFERLKLVDFSPLEKDFTKCPELSYWVMVRAPKIS